MAHLSPSHPFTMQQGEMPALGIYKLHTGICGPLMEGTMGLVPSLSHAVIITEYRPHTME
jgi:hypothetical protein